MSSLLSRTLLALGVSSLVAAAPVTRDSNSPLSRRAEAGPLLDGRHFPDPAIYFLDNTWYAFGTHAPNRGYNVQLASSPDFGAWSYIDKDAMPTLGAWVNADADDNVWAPDVMQVDDGSFVMYYSAVAASGNGPHCVGVATSGSITGPYNPAAEPLFCPLEQGGAIDASAFVDVDGSRYVLYKVDGGSVGNGGPCGNSVEPIQPTPIMLQPVEGDGVTLRGAATEIMNNNGAADEGTSEAPSLVRSPGPEGTYTLFFSTGCFNTDRYKIDYATASSITGPYTRTSTPLLVNGDNGLQSPGGADSWGDGHHIVFHAGAADLRPLYTATININGNVVSMA